MPLSIDDAGCILRTDGPGGRLRGIKRLERERSFHLRNALQLEAHLMIVGSGAAGATRKRVSGSHLIMTRGSAIKI
ncbi:hypothetical protein MAXJ12_24157 [Mesorhizobium alhagi CCNWXJ12-2]|uniref:Uncharacterized protein n=1 Tax=Mesorhizobium alhagi CCNWXJ12-2 TaxID=1107882 RepID=H0HXB2_9HYPH|nr:hypothetical protein MAXJ12_24157 [Mesorhizobium alhagi CCNWXJ12-2]